MTANILSNLSQNTEALDIARRKTQVSSPIREENLYMYHRLLRDENVLKELKELVESVSARKQLFETPLITIVMFWNLLLWSIVD